MIKTLAIYLVSFLALFFIIYLSQEFFYKQTEISIRFKLWHVNAFFAVISLLICVNIQLLLQIDSLKTKLGFVYLPTIFVKGIFFYLAFKNSILSIELLSFSERLSILIPFLIFLTLEAYFVFKMITKNEQ